MEDRKGFFLENRLQNRHHVLDCVMTRFAASTQNAIRESGSCILDFEIAENKGVQGLNRLRKKALI
jgi:hypothetical protein